MHYKNVFKGHSNIVRVLKDTNSNANIGISFYKISEMIVMGYWKQSLIQVITAECIGIHMVPVN